MMEQLILETISEHMNTKKMPRNGQHWFSKGNSYFTNAMNSYNEVTGLTKKGRAVDIVYLDLNKAFATVSYKNLMNKLSLCGLDDQTVRWIGNQLNSQAQRAMMSGTVQLVPSNYWCIPGVNTESSPIQHLH